MKNRYRITHSNIFGKATIVEFKSKKMAENYHKRLKKNNIKSVFQKLR